jgi:DNA-binding HxlR family transcriptional regulator
MKVCPIDRSLKIMGQRYALHIMRNMILLKQNRFNQFLNSIEGINTKTLAIRLRQLEEYGLVKRKVIPGKPAHTEYSPTEKGMAVRSILAEIASFSTNYEPEIIFVDKKPRKNMKALYGTENLSEVYDF